jgi:hypothetical protein
MNTAKTDKLWATASHPSTNDNEAANAFMLLRRAVSKDGGVERFISMRSGTASGRSDSEWARMYHRLSSQLEATQREHVFRIGEIERQNRTALTRAQRRVAEAENALREKEAELSDMKARGCDDLGVLDQRNAENLMLLERLNEMKRVLAEAEHARDQYVAERVAAAEQEIKERVRASLGEQDTAAEPKPNTKTTQSRRTRASAKPAASSSSRKRPSASRSKGRGSATDDLVLSLLTNEWKCISRLYREAQLAGFSGVENAIRWAAQRLTGLGNAEQGKDHEGRIAYRRLR